MRPLSVGNILIPIALLAGCGAENDQARSRLADSPPASVELRSNRLAFSRIDVPDALYTEALGANARGDIVGDYVDAAGNGHGFLRRRGVFTNIDFPGSVGGFAQGIGPGGEIVGAYQLATDDPATGFHGYLRTKEGVFVNVKYPGALNELLLRILPDGTILGCRHDNDYTASMRGIRIFRDGRHDEIDRYASTHTGGTPDHHRIVGFYTNRAAADRTEGYLIDRGVFAPLLYPGSKFTQAWDINPSGTIIGIYGEQESGPYHGFLLGKHGYVKIDVPFPGVTSTLAYGINARGDIVGNYSDALGTHGFIASSER
jgi:uncharacterized membrane protein